MGLRGRRTIATLALGVSLAVLAGCGKATTAGEFDPSIAEDFIRNKARADVQSNPILAVEEPRDPEVECREESPDKTDPADATRFQCDVRILDADGASIGNQSWEALVELDAVSGDSVVRDTRRLSSSIEAAPQP